MADQITKSTTIKSPNYPALNIEEALEKIEIIYAKDGKAGAPKDVTLKHLGFTSTKSGSAQRTLSALRKFGLIKVNQGRIILTDDALDLLIYPKTDGRYSSKIKEIALKPNIYRELIARYNNGFPSSETLRAELIREKDFNPNAVDEFLKKFFRTIEFAGINTIEDHETDNEEKIEEENTPEVNLFDNGTKEMQTATTIKSQTIESTTPQGVQTFPIPLSRGKKAALVFESLPIEKKDVDAIKKWLEFFSDNLTEHNNITD